VDFTKTEDLKQAVMDIYAELGVVYESAPGETHRYVFDTVRRMLPRRDEGPYTFSDLTVMEARETLATLAARHQREADMRRKLVT